MPSSSPTVPPPCWHPGDHGFTMAARAGVGVALDPDRPRTGLVVSGQGSPDTLLGIDIDAAATDHWVRGDDLTAVYEPADARRLRATAMWRRFDTPAAAGAAERQAAGPDAWMLVASAQTALLDSDPRLDVVSRVSGGTIRWHDGGEPAPRWRDGAVSGTRAVLIRGPAGLSTLVAVHPADCRSLEAAAAAGRTTVRCGLFGNSVEKGVLLRGRVLGAIGPATDDEAWAGRLLARFIAAPPPLTT